jgi:hypothetical protein
MRCALLVFVVACGGSVDVPRERLGDGEACDVDAHCVSGVCATTLPVEPSGVCFGPALDRCIRVLVFDTWADVACGTVGMAVALCGAAAPPSTLAACVIPSTVQPPDAYPYSCCETTVFE